eukprot:2897809-Pyramimonas_sp.AAC.1
MTGDFAVVVVNAPVGEASRASRSNPVYRLDEACEVGGRDSKGEFQVEEELSEVRVRSGGEIPEVPSLHGVVSSGPSGPLGFQGEECVIRQC